MPSARVFERVGFGCSTFRKGRPDRPLAYRVRRLACAADHKGRRCRVVDNPGRNDHDDKQPEQGLADAAQNRGRRSCRVALTARCTRQYLTISVEFLGQHRFFRRRSCDHLCRNTTRQNNSRNFQCSTGNESFVLCYGLPGDGFNIRVSRAGIGGKYSPRTREFRDKNARERP
jgi:hypothetical protein